MRLKYGTNPQQPFAEAGPLEGASSPFELRNGTPSMINLLDALNAWQLVRELRGALGLPAAASFKHVSPAGAAVATPLDDDLARAYEVEGRELTPAAVAYVRARGADPKCSFGDVVALSDRVDVETAGFLKGVVSDAIIAPGYDSDALKILSAKKGGGFIVLEADPDFIPPERESREVFGVKLVQDRNSVPLTLDVLKDVVCGQVDDDARRDLLLGLISLKYTQSNSMGYASGGQMIGIGAGQQSRVDCTKLAGGKADVWQLGRHPKVLELSFQRGVKRQDRINWRVRYIEGDLTAGETEALGAALDQPLDPLTADEKSEWLSRVDGVSLVSDAFIPFRDNIDHAARHGVRYVAQPGGSNRDAEVEAACREYGMAMVHTGVRLFHH
ncbi:MAG: phosphoribosylaminoimidazolecarboxamide formyltransferase [Deltaproteobacteria bacterium]|nr:phosphoribosylaminoimidazolecarboxamide formyltransferase [Deltaproteobacteria bacterium]MBW2413611.1 phosphoribosylaminoimidazolecarboxamide formyltransferase [Deltaproteobacteria bacterium]